MKTKLILGGTLFVLFASCSNDDVLQPSTINGDSESSKTEFAALFKSADKESLKNIYLRYRPAKICTYKKRPFPRLCFFIGCGTK
jgi:hypothetical protein